MSSEDKESYSELSCCCDEDSQEEYKNYQSDLIIIYSGFEGKNVITIIKLFSFFFKGELIDKNYNDIQGLFITSLINSIRNNPNKSIHPILA